MSTIFCFPLVPSAPLGNSYVKLYLCEKIQWMYTRREAGDFPQV